MNAYDRYLGDRATQGSGLHTKPIDEAELLAEVIQIIRDPGDGRRETR